MALVQDAASIARYLRHLGLPTEVPPMAPLSGARACPPCPPCPCPTRLRRARRLPEGHRFGQSRVLRRRYGEPPDAAEA